MNRMDAAGGRRLREFMGRIGGKLGNAARRACFATYAMGLLSEAERKSVEPLAADACTDPDRVDAHHQRLLHFIADSPWSDREVRREAASYALQALARYEPVEAWIFDDTGFLKQGNHSVGVQRQYTGSAGKVTNCQLGVSLTLATRTEHLPIDFELYLPKSWTEDAKRRQEVRIPNSVMFKTKPELALVMAKRAIEDGVSKGIALADSAYGSSSPFRQGLRALGLDYGVGVDPKTLVQLIDRKSQHPRGDPVSVRDLAVRIEARGGFRRCAWRKATKEDLSARFALRRITPAGSNAEREIQWLLIEWRDREREPANYFFVTLPETTTKKQIVRAVMQRWRTERVYQDLKGELGLDHYEGRSLPGWHHHVSVALCCYAFVLSERVQRFSPSPRRSLEYCPHGFAA